MDDFWSIAGVVGTVIFGILSVFLGVKAFKKNSIKHIFINSYEVGKGLMDKFPKFKILYGNMEIENNITILTGGFVNTGMDIKSDDIEFDLILPESCHIINMRINDCDNLKVTPTILNDYILHFKIDNKYLHNDLFVYSVIVESPEEMNKISDSLSFDHKMYNTERIGSIELTNNRTVILFYTIALCAIFLSCLGCFLDNLIYSFVALPLLFPLMFFFHKRIYELRIRLRCNFRS